MESSTPLWTIDSVASVDLAVLSSCEAFPPATVTLYVHSVSYIGAALLVRERATLGLAVAVDLVPDDAAATPAIDIETMAAPASSGAQRVAVRLTGFADRVDFGCSYMFPSPKCWLGDVRPLACHDVGKARRYASADWSENTWPDGQYGLSAMIRPRWRRTEP